MFSLFKRKSPAPRRVVFIGHSHLRVLRLAYAARTRRLAEAGVPNEQPAEFIQLSAAEFAPRLDLPDGSKRIFNRRTVKALSDPAVAAIVSCIGGNAYNVFGLTNHPCPFDFVLADDPALALDANAHILPYNAVRQSLKRRLANNIKLLTALRAQTQRPIFHLESPPPIPSERHIRSSPGRFRDRIAEFGIAPPGLRYKLWRLQSSLVREACEALDIAFVSVPRLTQDEAGMMVERGWARDATHGNAWYGARVLNTVLTTLTGADSARRLDDEQPLS
jgi:hypothetical protein